MDRLWKMDSLKSCLQRENIYRQMYEEARLEIQRIVADARERDPLEASEDSAWPAADSHLASGEILAEQDALNRSDTAVNALNKTFHTLLAENKDVILIGEDILDPYGGAFRVTAGLSTRFPHQVFSTPIAEAGLVGVANGLALAGMRPVAEVMLSDFVTLAADQLINFSAKFHYMYGGHVRCPLTVRIVSGSGGGSGPTHSQSLEFLFCGIPGLRVVALSPRHNPARLLTHVVLGEDGPTLFVENKRLYKKRSTGNPPRDLHFLQAFRSGGSYPPLIYVPEDSGRPDVTLVTYGGLTVLAERAMRLMVYEDELRFDYIILTQLWPLDIPEVGESVLRSGRLLVVEETVPDFGLGSAVISRVAERSARDVRFRAVGSEPVPFPSTRHLEDQVRPSVQKIVFAVRDLVGEKTG